MRILDIVDDQCGFMRKGSDLPVGASQEGAEELIAPTNEFFKALKPGTFDFALFKYDTHFSEEYKKSPESQAFPNIHCEYGTAGWQLAVDDSLLRGRMPVYYMTKNTFDMWADNPVSADLEFKNAIEAAAYANLYHVTTDPACLEQGTHRDEFLKDAGPGDEAVIIGVASDFCVHDAMLGYLKRGVKVTVLHDLVKGIGTPVPGRAPSGHIRDVVNLPVFRPYLDSGKLSVKSSADFLHEAQPESKRSAAPRPGL